MARMLLIIRLMDLLTIFRQVVLPVYDDLLQIRLKKFLECFLNKIFSFDLVFLETSMMLHFMYDCRTK